MNQMYSNPYMARMQSPMMQQSNGIQWVQGIEGAKAWQLMPNSNIMLLDSENDGRFYIKTSDNVGMCSLRVFKFEEITASLEKKTDVDLSEYVKKSELQELITNMVGGKKNEQPVPTATSTSLALITE